MKQKRPGHILAFALAVLGILFVLTTVSLQLVHREGSSANRSYVSHQALSLAEAGIDHAIRQLNANSNYLGETDTALGNGTFSLNITGTGTSRTIHSTGFVPNSASPLMQRTIVVEASLNSQNVEFFYGVQVDGGGIQMGNNSRINGNVYSNGNIVGNSGATITGDTIVAGGLAENPTIASEIQDSDELFATTSDNEDIAQSFTATASEPLTKVSLFLGKIGNPSANIAVRIAPNTGNAPDKSSLANSVIAYPSVGLTPSWIDVTFSNPASLTNGATYWIVLDTNSHSTTNHWLWREDTGSNYPNNSGKHTGNCCSGNPSWSDVGGDLMFRAWLGGVATRTESVSIGNATTGSGRANLFVDTTIRGTSCPNTYCIVSNPSPEPLPLSDGVVTDWKNVAAAGGELVGDFSLTNGAVGSLGPKKINGNFLLDNNAILTMTGTLWVTGTITISNGARLQLDSGYGQNSGMVIADGTIVVSNNATFVGAGQGSFIMILTTRDDKNGVAITVDNNSTGVIYYAAKSRIQFANNATAKEATAWGINLSNNASITYDSGLANSTFTGGPGGGWSVTRGTWRMLD